MEFIMWQLYLDEVQWHQHDKKDHMLASVAYEVRRIAVGLSKNAKMPKFEDFLATFKRRGETVEDSSLGREVEDGDFDTGGGLPGIEIGQANLDDKWKNVAETAKQDYLHILGDFIVSKSGF